VVLLQWLLPLQLLYLILLPMKVLLRLKEKLLLLLMLWLVLVLLLYGTLGTKISAAKRGYLVLLLFVLESGNRGWLQATMLVALF
jgi:hypothetical protein